VRPAAEKWSSVGDLATAPSGVGTRGTPGRARRSTARRSGRRRAGAAGGLCARARGWRRAGVFAVLLRFRRRTRSGGSDGDGRRNGGWFGRRRRRWFHHRRGRGDFRSDRLVRWFRTGERDDRDDDADEKEHAAHDAPEHEQLAILRGSRTRCSRNRLGRPPRPVYGRRRDGTRRWSADRGRTIRCGRVRSALLLRHVRSRLRGERRRSRCGSRCGTNRRRRLSRWTCRGRVAWDGGRGARRCLRWARLRIHGEQFRGRVGGGCFDRYRCYRSRLITGRTPIVRIGQRLLCNRGIDDGRRSAARAVARYVRSLSTSARWKVPSGGIAHVLIWVSTFDSAGQHSRSFAALTETPA
jgi:hypothetical protein